MDPATLEKLIVREIRKAREISRRDLADQLGIAKSTAGRRVDSMIARGLLCEKGVETRKEVGRPRRFLDLDGNYGAFAGFDFDARTLYGVLIDFAQQTVEKSRIELSSSPGRDEIIAKIRGLLDQFESNEAGLPLLGIGFGVPGHVQRDTRTALGYPYVDGWKNVDLLDELDLTPERLHIENNTRAIALGEYWLGERGPSDHMACLNVRTGISAGIISDGRLLSGRHEMAGEIRGWSAVPESKANLERDWLEEVATVRAFADIGWEKFVSDFNGGSEKAAERLEIVCSDHGDAVSRIVQLVDPEIIFLAGAFTELGDRYLEMVRRSVAASLEGHYFSPPRIQFVSLGEYAGALGASALAASHFLPDPG